VRKSERTLGLPLFKLIRRSRLSSKNFPSPSQNFFLAVSSWLRSMPIHAVGISSWRPVTFHSARSRGIPARPISVKRWGSTAMLLLLNGQWELALQAGVFSIFNMSAPSGSRDLVNADYTVGLLTSYRIGPFSGFLRLHHQSSHLGDEFILNSQTPVKRVNLSFEEVDLKVSYELASWFRIYGGGGMLVGRDLKDLTRGTSQVGVELTSPWTLWDGKMRPVAYADFQANERSNWRVAGSVMAGLQFENARIGDRRLQVLAEYVGGPSPNGQFYTQNTEWIGVGIHLYY